MADIDAPKVEVDPTLLSESMSPKQTPPPRTPAPARFPETPPSISQPGSGRLPDPVPAKLGAPRFRLPLWALLASLFVALGALVLFLDLRNRDRFLIVCGEGTLELHRGRRFPLPVGHERIGGEAYRPVRVPSGTDCRPQVFDDLAEAEKGFLAFLVERAKASLDRPESADLEEVRSLVMQARLLGREPSQRPVLDALLAEAGYREGRARMARAEHELRSAIARFQEARTYGGQRFGDLSPWIRHLEAVLHSVRPSPPPLPVSPSAPGPTPPSLPARPLPSEPAQVPGSTASPASPPPGSLDRGLPRPAIDAGPRPRDSSPARSDRGLATDPGGILL